MAKKPKKPTRAELDQMRERLWQHYRHRSNVTGADVGTIWRDGKRTDEIGLRIHVAHKIPLSELETTQVFPAEFEGVPLDVIAGDYKPGLTQEEVNRRRTSHFLMGGLSCGPVGEGAGTLGAIVIDQTSGKPSILSNWHVLAGPNGVPGAPITQAATLDNGHPQRDVVAHLGQSILDQDGDAALAPLSGKRSWLPIISGEHDYLTSIRDSRLGETLRKSGRTTGFTEAKVDGEGIYRISYEVSPGRVEPRTIRGFKLVAVEPGNPDNVEVSAPGDSGSVWYHHTSKAAVGLHFAGEINPAPGQEHAIACNMTSVARRLNFRMATFDDLLEAEAQSAQDAAGQGGPAQELTPQPDWPDPVWPWWPFPIDGPWGPWPPRFPWGPHGPGTPWGPNGPRFAAGNRPTGGIDLGDPRDFATGLPRGRAFPESSGMQAAQARPQMSVYGEIWPALQAALIEYRYDNARSYTPQTKTSVLLDEGNPGTILWIVIRRSDKFWNDGIRIPPADLRNCPIFDNVLEVLAMAYANLGYGVVR